VRRLSGRVAALLGLLLLLTTLPAAHAIETASFGLAPGGRDQHRTSLHEEVKPGDRVDDAVRLWNKTDKPLTLALSVQGASLDAGGSVKLGGTGGASGWVRLGQSSVTLAPGASASVPLVVQAPRTMPSGTATAAVVAEPAGSGGAVVQRVALMVYVSAPSGSPLRAALGWIVWIAVALVVLVAGWALRAQWSRPAT
jgi:hypothetical protein